MKKAILIVFLIVAVVAVAAGAFVFLRSGNATGVDTWIARQVVRIASAYIEPTIDFKSVRYTAPYRVEMHGATLTARDGTPVGAVGMLVLELAETPALGQPLKIRQIVLDKPSLNLIESPDGKGFKGLVPFVRGTTEQRAVEEDVRLSNVLRLDRLTLRDGQLRYQPAGGSAPMDLTGLTLDLSVANAASDADGAWYDIDTSFGRPPQLAAAVKAAVNLDTKVARVAACDVSIDVSQSTLGELPPALQDVLREHEARGKLAASLSGTVPVTHIADGDLSATVTVTDFNLGVGEYHFPIERGDLDCALKGGVADLSTVDVRTLGGSITGKGAARLAEPGRPAELTWKVEHVNIRELLRAGAKPGEQPKLAGILDGAGAVRTSLDDPQGTLGGDGSVSVREGRLLLLPGLRQLAEAMNVGAKLLGSTEYTHEADAKFKLTPRAAEITESEVTTEFMAARSTGPINFDGTMDLRANAGPLERVEGLLGAVGRVIGAVTDKAVKYRIHGPMKDPKVDVLPLGLGG